MKKKAALLIFTLALLAVSTWGVSYEVKLQKTAVVAPNLSGPPPPCNPLKEVCPM